MEGTEMVWAQGMSFFFLLDYTNIPLLLHVWHHHHHQTGRKGPKQTILALDHGTQFEMCQTSLEPW